MPYTNSIHCIKHRSYPQTGPQGHFTHTHTHTHTHTYTGTHTHLHTHTHTHTCTRTHTHAHVRERERETHTHTHTHARAHTHTHTFCCSVCLTAAVRNVSYSISHLQTAGEGVQVKSWPRQALNTTRSWAKYRPYRCFLGKHAYNIIQIMSQVPNGP